MANKIFSLSGLDHFVWKTFYEYKILYIKCYQGISSALTLNYKNIFKKRELIDLACGRLGLYVEVL